MFLVYRIRYCWYSWAAVRVQFRAEPDSSFFSRAGNPALSIPARTTARSGTTAPAASIAPDSTRAR